MTHLQKAWRQGESLLNSEGGSKRREVERTGGVDAVEVRFIFSLCVLTGWMSTDSCGSRCRLPGRGIIESDPVLTEDEKKSTNAKALRDNTHPGRLFVSDKCHCCQWALFIHYWCALERPRCVQYCSCIWRMPHENTELRLFIVIIIILYFIILFIVFLLFSNEHGGQWTHINRELIEGTVHIESSVNCCLSYRQSEGQLSQSPCLSIHDLLTLSSIVMHLASMSGSAFVPAGTHALARAHTHAH